MINKTNEVIKREADEFFDSINVNDFYSFTRSLFKDNVLIDLSYEKAVKDANAAKDFKKRLQNIASEIDITEFDRLVIESIMDFCEYIDSFEEYYWFKFNITHNTCPIPYLLKGLSNYPILNENDLNSFTMLLEQFPGVVRFIREKLHIQREKGIMLPLEECEIINKMLLGFIQDPENGGMSFNKKAGSLKIADRISHLNRITDAINNFNDEMRLTVDYIEKDYMPNKVGKPGLCSLRDGRGYYSKLIKIYTSYDLSPEEIHEIGLKNLEITKNKMEGIIKGLGFNCGIQEFNKLLEGNPDYIDKTRESLGRRLTGFLDKVRPLMKDYFYKLPEADCEVRAIDVERESSTSWGYYAMPVGTDKKGVYYYSGGELDKRCQVRAAAIVYHELMPGHHYQMNLIIEDESLPKICRMHFNTAFADGWAEYSADLANEMGLYTEYDLYGRYLWDLVLCTRLVVDTGLNAMNWSMDKARSFMRENTSLTETEILTESLRYSVDMPGQALAYKMGSLKMHEFRNRIQSELSEGFNIKDYHNAVLEMGSIPLNILEKKLDLY